MQINRLNGGANERDTNRVNLALNFWLNPALDLPTAWSLLVRVKKRTSLVGAESLSLWSVAYIGVSRRQTDDLQ